MVFFYIHTIMSTTITSFNSSENISLLWEILIEEKFISIPDMEPSKPIFTQLINDLTNTPQTIIWKNKTVLNTFINRIRDTKHAPQSGTRVSRSGDDFSTRFAEMKSNFDSVNAAPKRVEINFAENVDESSSGIPNTDSLMRDRGYDMSPSIPSASHHQVDTYVGTGTTSLSEL